jgi:GntR family transcriptional regulator, transcriptional repressor for pyruvate dehydrogenase complex
MRSRKDGSGSISETVTDHVVSLISEGKIRPGERLPSEHDLMRQLNVGRSSVREAIRGLAMMGIVEPRRRRGTIVVSPVSNAFGDRIDRSIVYWAVRDLFEVRAILEGQAAAMAATLATTDDIGQIEKSAAVVEQKIRSGSLHFDHNTKFHLAIARASHNPVLVFCLQSLIGSFRDVRLQFNETLLDMPERDIEEHRKIVEAIKSRDPKRARRSMQVHMNSYVKQVEQPRRVPADRPPATGRKSRVPARRRATGGHNSRD